MKENPFLANSVQFCNISGLNLPEVYRPDKCTETHKKSLEKISLKRYLNKCRIQLHNNKVNHLPEVLLPNLPHLPALLCHGEVVDVNLKTLTPCNLVICFWKKNTNFHLRKYCEIERKTRHLLSSLNHIHGPQLIHTWSDNQPINNTCALFKSFEACFGTLQLSHHRSEQIRTKRQR